MKTDFKNIEILEPETAIPDRYLNCESPPVELLELINEYSNLLHFIAYSSKLTSEEKIESEANRKRTNELRYQIVSMGYNGTFCRIQYGYAQMVKIDLSQTDPIDTIKITWHHLL